MQAMTIAMCSSMPSEDRLPSLQGGLCLAARLLLNISQRANDRRSDKCGGGPGARWQQRLGLRLVSQPPQECRSAEALAGSCHRRAPIAVQEARRRGGAGLE